MAKKATGREKYIVLPKLELLKPMKDPPHRQRRVAECVVRRAGLVDLHVYVTSNWPSTRWWVLALIKCSDGSMMRATNGLTTSSKALAARWVECVRAGEVRDGDYRDATTEKTDNRSRRGVGRHGDIARITPYMGTRDVVIQLQTKCDGSFDTIEEAHRDRGLFPNRRAALKWLDENFPEV